MDYFKIKLEHVDLIGRKVIKTHGYFIELFHNHLHYYEDLDKEVPVESDTDLLGDKELEVLPEYNSTYVKKEFIIGVDLIWDQDQLK
jgi:hypothetical protein